jgi:lipoprotein-anchoring transpeptidase ErfK/SrfK
LRLVILALGFLALTGCADHTRLEPASRANWTARDQELLANPPYAQVAIPRDYQRSIVDYRRYEAPGTIVVDTDNKYLSYVLPDHKAIRYGVTVGEEALAWSGIAQIGRMEEWPSWVPTEEIKQRLGNLPNYVAPGPGNPMGARALYLYENNKDTLYRIHGTNQPEYIGQAISSGCIRMTNEDVIDLYGRAAIGGTVVVLAPGEGDKSARMAFGGWPRW